MLHNDTVDGLLLYIVLARADEFTLPVCGGASLSPAFHIRGVNVVSFEPIVDTHSLQDGRLHGRSQLDLVIGNTEIKDT